MDTARSSTVAAIPLLLALVVGSMSGLVLSLEVRESALWAAGLLVPAVLVLAVHTLILELVRRVDTRRVRRRVNAALVRADGESLRKAAAQVAEAERDWPGSDLGTLGVALEITRHRLKS